MSNLMSMSAPVADIAPLHAQLPANLMVPKGHVIGLSREPQQVFDTMNRNLIHKFETQDRNTTDQSTLAFQFGEELPSGGGFCPMLVGLKTPNRVYCSRRSDVDAPDALVIFFTCKGLVVYQDGGNGRPMALGDVIVSRAQDVRNFTILPDFEGGRLSFTASDVLVALHALGVDDASAIPQFNAVAPPSLSTFIHLAIQRVLAMLNSNYAKRAVSYAVRQMREDIIMSLLVGHPHSMSEALLSAQQRQGSPRQVRRAVEFIEQFADHDISLSDIAIAAQCSARNLTRLFREATGDTPMGFLRETRLNRARDQIIQRPELPLGDVAVQWGFCHSGQFAQHYRRKFGESPSDTRRRY